MIAGITDIYISVFLFQKCAVSILKFCSYVQECLWNISVSFINFIWFLIFSQLFYFLINNTCIWVKMSYETKQSLFYPSSLSGSSYLNLLFLLLVFNFIFLSNDLILPFLNLSSLVVIIHRFPFVTSLSCYSHIFFFKCSALFSMIESDLKSSQQN